MIMDFAGHLLNPCMSFVYSSKRRVITTLLSSNQLYLL